MTTKYLPDSHGAVRFISQLLTKIMSGRCLRFLFSLLSDLPLYTESQSFDPVLLICQSYSGSELVKTTKFCLGSLYFSEIRLKSFIFNRNRSLVRQKVSYFVKIVLDLAEKAID